VNPLVACAALCRTGSFRSSQQCRFLQASAFGVAVNRSSVLPDDGHDEMCVGGCFALFRHRDKSSAPPRVMGRLAPSAYQSAGDEWQVQSKRPDRGPFLRGISRHVKTPKFQPRFVPWTRIISSDVGLTSRKAGGAARAGTSAVACVSPRRAHGATVGITSHQIAARQNTVIVRNRRVLTLRMCAGFLTRRTRVSSCREISRD
jgi:hypothetical protein